MKKKLMLFLLALPFFSITGFTQDSSEYQDFQVMSTMLVRICRLATWPHDQDPNKPFIITVLGSPSDEEELFFSKNVEINKRKVLVHKIRKMEDFKGGDVLFITMSEQSHLKNILAIVENKPILTVTLCDSTGMALKGVMVNFFLNKNDQISFIINLNSLRKASIEINSAVLIKAVRVIDSERGTSLVGER